MDDLFEVQGTLTAMYSQFIADSDCSLLTLIMDQVHAEVNIACCVHAESLQRLDWVIF